MEPKKLRSRLQCSLKPDPVATGLRWNVVGRVIVAFANVCKVLAWTTFLTYISPSNMEIANYLVRTLAPRTGTNMALVAGAITHFVPYATIFAPVASAVGLTGYAIQAAQRSDTADKDEVDALLRETQKHLVVPLRDWIAKLSSREHQS